ncbi:MAG: MBL fold metallo-hydrolase [Clostridia bacterium]|nr:MBL fold metallo-hydrolase [Clostridia bacterium]
MRIAKSFIAGTIIVALLALSALFTWGHNFDERVPTWDDVYEFFGMAERIEKGEVYEQPFTMSFLDVGQGSATLIHCKDPDFTMLVDTGEQGNDGVILDELKRLGTKRLDYVVLSHPHADHVGSFPELAKSNVTISNVMLPLLDTDRLGEDTALYHVILGAVRTSGAKTVTAKPGMRIEKNAKSGDGKVTVEVLGPIGGKEAQTGNLNNRSVFVKVTYGDVSVLITGDGEWQEEDDVITWLNSDEGKASGVTGQATILVAGHHGSYTSSSRRFLAVVQPKYGIISCGKDNDFGHPHDSTLENFKDANARVYRTDELGTIVIGTDGKTLVN